MIRRAFLVAAAAVALTLAPSVAMADTTYGAHGEYFTVTPPSGPLNTVFTATMSHATQNEIVTLTVNGPGGSNKNNVVIDGGGLKQSDMSSLAKQFTVGSSVSFTVKPTAIYGDYVLNLTIPDPAKPNKVIIVRTQTVTVARSLAGINAAAVADVRPNNQGLGGVALTVGGASVVGSAGALVFARRRRSARVPS